MEVWEAAVLVGRNAPVEELPEAPQLLDEDGLTPEQRRSMFELLKMTEVH